MHIRYDVKRTSTARALCCLLLVTGCSLLSFPSPAQVTIDSQGTKISPTTRQDWLRHPDEASSYQESWTSVLYSQAGHIIYVSFMYTNIGVFSGSTSVVVSLTHPGEQAKAYRFDYDTDDFSQSANTGRIAIAGNYMTLSKRRLELVVDEKDLGLDLDITPWMPGVKLYNGRIWLDNDHSEWVMSFFHVPRGRFRGSLRHRNKTIQIQGDTYLDHLVQNELATDYSTHWWAMRFFAPKHTVAFLVWRTTKDRGGRDVSHLIVTDEKKILAFTNKMQLRPSEFGHDPDGHPYAQRFTIDYTSKRNPPFSLTGAVRSQRRHERDALLERLSWAERQVVGLVAGNPVMYRMLGQAKLALNANGQQIALEGAALMESLVLSEDD